MAAGEVDFSNVENQARRPRRLTPRECARLMGFETPDGKPFRIPVSDTQSYRQFGNSVVVPVFEAVARLLDLTSSRQFLPRLIKHNGYSRLSRVGSFLW